MCAASVAEARATQVWETGSTQVWEAGTTDVRRVLQVTGVWEAAGATQVWETAGATHVRQVCVLQVTGVGWYPDSWGVMSCSSDGGVVGWDLRLGQSLWQV